MKKLMDKFYQILLIILLIFVLHVIYCSIFNIYKNNLNLKPIVIIIGCVVLVFAFLRIKKIIEKIPDNKITIIAIFICLFFLIGLIIFGNLVTSIPVADLSNIQVEANKMINNGGNIVSDDYFMSYPNQKPLALFVYWIYRLSQLLGINNMKMFAICVNAALMATTGFFIFLSVKKISNARRGLLILIFFVINPIFYLYSSYFYSDLLCMPFAAIAIYMFASARENESLKNKTLLEIMATIFVVLGTEIRIVVSFLVIAFIISIFISNENKKQKIIQFLSIVFVFILGTMCFSLIIKKHDETKNEELKFPPFHWIMMGLNYEKDGRWNIDDYMYTYNNKTYQEKKKNDIKKIKERINNLKVSGLIDLGQKKISVNWSNGDYDYVGKLLNSEQINGTYSYITGNRRIFIIYYCQICKAVVMFMFLIGIIMEINSKKGSDSKNSIIYIAIFGAFIFYLIWEVSSRYSLSFLPWLIITFGYGIECIEKLVNIEEIKIKFKNDILKRVNIKRIYRIIICSVFTVSIALLTINFDKYAVIKKGRWDIRVMQWGTNKKEINSIAEKNIQQTFKTNKTFNSISIIFIKGNLKNTTKYNFILRDDSGKELTNQEFESNQIDNGNLKTFKFNRIKPKGNQIYTIEISSIDATQDNSIGIASFYQEGYDAYPNGVLRINGEKKDNIDIAFQVQNDVERTYISKKVYILLSFFVILIEIFAFYPFLTYNRSVKEIEGGI